MQTSLEAVEAAKKSWACAPTHIKLMASAYVLPILAALEVISAEIEAMKGASHG